MNKKIIGSFIRQLREEKKKSRADIARGTGVSEFKISLWENGVLLPEFYNLEMLSVQLNITVNELLVGERLKTVNDDYVFSYAMYEKRKNIFKVSFVFILFIALIILCVLKF